jgi:hypothetical protein|nr:MAG TPA: hypothetical protein [Caudoviricetes sp.]
MTNTDDLEAKLKAAQEEIARLRRKKVVLPSCAAEILRKIKESAQAALNAKTMTSKDRRLRGIISRIGNP